jgi:SAM-dependent methyltransferase
MLAEPVDLALDLGTGCGIQALHAARHARRVIATDISERALELAQFNAALNRFTNIEFRLGSLFAPVEGEQFGHIVSNPPFVITPRGSADEPSGVPEYEYRDGGMVGDALVATVIRGAEGHLAPGGVAQLLGNWEYGAEAGLERVRGWIESTGLDAWVVERERQSVAQYAETWIRDGGTRPGPEFDRLYEAWLDDFAGRGVTEVGFGYVTLRRPLAGAPTLRRFEHYGEPLGGSLGDHIQAVLAAHDWLQVRDAAALAAESLTVAPDVTEERHYWPGEEHPTVMLLRQGSGFARTIPAGTALAAVVGACDGTLTIGTIVTAVAELLDVDAAALAAELEPQLRELVLVGVLHVGH